MSDGLNVYGRLSTSLASLYLSRLGTIRSFELLSKQRALKHKLTLEHALEFSRGEPKLHKIAYASLQYCL